MSGTTSNWLFFGIHIIINLYLIRLFPEVIKRFGSFPGSMLVSPIEHEVNLFNAVRALLIADSTFIIAEVFIQPPCAIVISLHKLFAIEMKDLETPCILDTPAN